jgi:hypothetical protein
MIRYADSAFRHGVTKEEIDFVYASALTKWYPNGRSDRGNERAMLVGFNSRGNLIEIGLELLPGASFEDDDEEYFYHAMPATFQWQRNYRRKNRE